MAKLLHAAGIPVTLVMIQNDGHGLDAPIAGKEEIIERTIQKLERPVFEWSVQ